jgi:hypothetical protein
MSKTQEMSKSTCARAQSAFLTKKGPQKWQQHRCDAAAETKLKVDKNADSVKDHVLVPADWLQTWHCADVLATKSAVGGKKCRELNAR